MLSRIIVAVLLLGVTAVIVIIYAKPRQKKQHEIASTETPVGAIDYEYKVDSIKKQIYSDALLDTVGVSNAPIKVLSAKIVREEYSTYRSIRLAYKNVSGKKISAVRFKWYGTDAFGEPAEMGGVVDGYGGGVSDDPIKPGGTDAGTWSILSRNVKKVELAWPFEVAFEDGTKWKSTR